jgi:AhpD family alkylhydroperoxidase
MSAGCCGGSGCGGGQKTVTNADASLRAFGEFMRESAAPGAIDEKTKELILAALVILSKCEPCLDMHFQKAIKSGISKAEIDEAAWLAAAMGGAPVRTFYACWLKKNGF